MNIQKYIGSLQRNQGWELHYVHALWTETDRQIINLVIY